MIKSFFIGLIGLFVLPLIAQTNNDPVYVNFNYFPNRDMGKIEGSAVYNQLEVNLIMPGFNLSKTTKVYTNLNYKLSNYHYDEANDGLLPNNLNDIRLGLIIRQKITKNWEAILAPRLNARTDFEEKFGKRDLFPSVHLLGLRTSEKNKDLTYGLGISYNNESKKNLVIPLLFFEYKNENFRAFTILPSFAYFLMTPTQKLEYGLSLNLEAAMFHIKHFSPDNSPNYLRTQNITIAPTFSYEFYKNFWFNLKSGYALPGKYQFMDADFDDLPVTKDNKFKGGFFITAGVSLRVKEKE